MIRHCTSKFAGTVTIIVLVMVFFTAAVHPQNTAGKGAKDQFPNKGEAKDQFAGPAPKKDPCQQKKDRIAAALDSAAGEVKAKWDATVSGKLLGMPIENTTSVGGSGENLPGRYREVQKMKGEVGKLDCSKLDQWAKDHGFGEEELEAQEGQAQYRYLTQELGMSREEALKTMRQGAEENAIILNTAETDPEKRIKNLEGLRNRFKSVDPATSAIYDQKIKDEKGAVALGKEFDKNDGRLRDALKTSSSAKSASKGLDALKTVFGDLPANPNANKATKVSDAEIKPVSGGQDYWKSKDRVLNAATGDDQKNYTTHGMPPDTGSETKFPETLLNPARYGGGWSSGEMKQQYDKVINPISSQEKEAIPEELKRALWNSSSEYQALDTALKASRGNAYKADDYIIQARRAYADDQQKKIGKPLEKLSPTEVRQLHHPALVPADTFLQAYKQTYETDSIAVGLFNVYRIQKGAAWAIAERLDSKSPDAPNHWPIGATDTDSGTPQSPPDVWKYEAALAGRKAAIADRMASDALFRKAWKTAFERSQ